MNDWVVAALCPHDVLPVNGRDPGYSRSATALSFVLLGRLMEYDLWRGRESPESVPDLLGEYPMPSSEWAFVRSVLRSVLDETQEMGAIELENFAFDGDLDSDLRAISCILASVAYADMEMHDQALHICERLLEEQPDLSAFPSVMMQLQASLRNAEVKKYSRALYWANSAKVKIAEFPPGGAHTLKVALDGLKYSAESNVGAMNAMLSDEFLLAERGDRPASPASGSTLTQWHPQPLLSTCRRTSKIELEIEPCRSLLARSEMMTTSRVTCTPTTCAYRWLVIGIDTLKLLSGLGWSECFDHLRAQTE